MFSEKRYGSNAQSQKMEIVKNADCFRFREMFFFYKLEIEVLEFSDRIWYSKATGKRENLKRKEKR